MQHGGSFGGGSWAIEATRVTKRLMDAIECRGGVLECTECGETFYVSAEQEAWFSKMGFQKPKRCPLCRKRRGRKIADKCEVSDAEFERIMKAARGELARWER